MDHEPPAEKDPREVEPALYELPDPELPKRLEPHTSTPSRYFFRRAMEEHTPEVLEDLRGTVLPVYQSMSIETARKSYANRELRPIEEVGRGLDLDPLFSSDLPVTWREVRWGKDRSDEGHALHTALQNWSEKFHLTEEWLLDLALHTLHHWRTVEADLHWHQLPSNEMGFFDGQGDELAFYCAGERRFFHPGWDLSKEDWPNFARSIQAAFKRFLDDYHRQVVKDAVLGGWTKAENIKDNRQRFGWLALNLVRGLNVTVMLKTGPGLKVSPSDITKQIKATAQQVGVGHCLQKGRPKKSESPS